MGDLVKSVENAILSVRPLNDHESMSCLAEVQGRGPMQFATRLCDWLESNPGALPEQVRAEYVDNPNDRGVDVVLVGRISKLEIGFQIKSDNDLATSGFTTKLKAQITDAQSWGLSHLVIILACQPTEKNQQKYLHLHNDVLRWPGDTKPLIVNPNRAAGLWNSFAKPMEVPDGERTWSYFFTEVGQSSLAHHFLDNWPTLSPHDRFQEPEEFGKLLELCKSSPITVVSGPPAAGKTFAAVMALWAAFREGRRVSWIAASSFSWTEGPIPEPTPPHRLEYDLKSLVRELGPKPPTPPVDIHDLIAQHLPIGTLLYVEDPFGRDESEFERSFHTYPFFDLLALGRSLQIPPRDGCNILISTRDSLFEKWKTGRDLGELSELMQTIRLSRSSYRSWNLRQGARALAEARSAADPDAVAAAVANASDYPFEVEIICKDLPDAPTEEDAVDRASHTGATLLKRVLTRLQTTEDSEALFLFLVSALARDGTRLDDLKKSFGLLLRNLAIDADADQLSEQLRKQYRSVLTFHPSESRKNRKGAERKGIDLALLFPRDDLWISHSVVAEAIEHRIRTDHLSLARRIAKTLHLSFCGGTPAQSSETPLSLEASWKKRTSGKILLFLVQLGLAKDEQAGPALIHVVSDPESLDSETTIEILHRWRDLPPLFRSSWLNMIGQRDSWEIAKVACLLPEAAVAPREAWQVLRTLAERDIWRESGFGLISHPWEYLFRNVEIAPQDLTERVDKQAKQRPQDFVYDLATVAIRHWDRIPDLWKARIWAVREMDASEFWEGEVHSSVMLAIADQWPPVTELRQLLLDEATSPNWKRRGNVARAAALYFDRDPEVFGELLRKTLEDPEVRVPLAALDTVGDSKSHAEFAEAVLRRPEPGVPAEMTEILAKDLRYSSTPWKQKLLQECLGAGGELAEAALAYSWFEAGQEFKGLNYGGPPSLEEASEPVKLAWLWAYATSGGRRPEIEPSKVVEILRQLNSPFREFAIFYVAMQATRLPELVRNYIDALTDPKVEQGKAERPANENVTWTYGFPNLSIAEAVSD